MSEAIVIAVKLLGQSDDVQPEPFYISQGISWRDLRAMLLALYDDQPDELDVRYQDEDGDLCILSSDDELQEAFRDASTTANVLQLNVKTMDQDNDYDPAEVHMIHVNPHSLFTDAEKEEQSLLSPVLERLCSWHVLNQRPLLKHRRKLRSQPEVASELAETGEVTPKHVFDEETGLIHNQILPEPIKPAYHEPVVRKKACYYEIEGSDQSSKEMDKLIKHVADKLGENQDQESGELSSTKSDEGDGEAMPYQAFVHFMEKLKQELRNEIVHDVTKKTVKQVLRGLDSAWPYGARDRKDSRSSHPLYLHEKILCDKCQKTIIGPRYKCGNCPNFDLCEECESKPGIHDQDHVFIKLRRPCLDAGLKDGRKVPLLKHLLYADNTERHTEEHDRLRARKVAEKLARRQEKMKKREEKVQEKQKRKEDKLKRKLEKLDVHAMKDHPQKKEKVETQALPLPTFKYPYQVLGAEFVRDITIPDYTHVQPGTRMQKTWRMKNTGSHQWSASTQLRLMWGTIPAPKTEVTVPALPPSQEGNITVELIAPEDPGRYQSHWKLFDRGVNFGHRVWCSIDVEPKEVLEPTRPDHLKMVDSTDGQAEAAVCKEDEEDPEEKFEEPQVDDPAEEIFLEAVEEKQTTPLIMASKLVPAAVIPEVKEEAVVEPTEVKVEESEVKVDESEVKVTESVAIQVETQMLEAVSKVGLPKFGEATAVEGVVDLLSFEFLDLSDRKTSKASQTATPNNTPLDVSPPKSPAPEPFIPATVSNSSSVELVGSEAENNLPHLTEYVQQRMASLELKPDTYDEADIESLSSLSLSDDDSDDYCIVPLPDCFNTEVPLTRSVAGPVDDNQNEIGVPDENLSEDTSVTPQPSLDEMLTTSNVVSTPALDPEPAVQRNEDPVPPQEGEQLQVDETETKQKQVEEDEDEDEEEQMEEASAAVPMQTARVVDENQNSEEDREGTSPIQSTPSEFVNQLFHTAIIAATKAGAKAYSTTKDVFNSMQAKQWKPNENNWTPPKNTWNPPDSTWTPPEDNYVPPQSTWTGPSPQEPTPVTTDPMVRLMEMGFCNRELNKGLLERFNGDLEPVIQELLQQVERDWSAARHGSTNQ
ncbi:next to BRCA1 gene 1 protein-like [Haliotis rubra]|uniref:next to BRCA1 gene 1 protein-like n=1 Tax=Haliotis rubra TaxID=36100 RepID=UPI001EE4EF5F|nr:next to BRCA1 gene 1 protein-like [Haliotis rubra]